jgi:hypothetical protein
VRGRHRATIMNLHPRLLLTPCLAIVCILGTDVAAAQTPTNDLLSHARWQAVLVEHVRDGRVDYNALARRPDPLRGYLASLVAVDPAQFAALPKPDRLAFWVNAYNAWTVDLVLRNSPLESIRDIVPLWKRALGNSAFSLPFIPLGQLDPRGARSEPLSLDDIEHGIIRPLFGEPRAHFALVCASVSCPELRSEAWTGAMLEAQLEDAGRRLLGDKTKNRYVPDTHVLQLSSIFMWFREDFESAGGLVTFAARYLPEADQVLLRAQNDPPNIEFLPYDWSLNAR